MTLGPSGSDRPADRVSGPPGGSVPEPERPAEPPAATARREGDPGAAAAADGPPAGTATDHRAGLGAGLGGEPGGEPGAVTAAVHGGEPGTVTGTGPDTGRAAGRAGRRRKPRLTFLQELPFLVVAALVLAVIIKAFAVQAFYIPSGSMERTLHGCDGCRGDRVMVNKLSYHLHPIHRGDIVVFDGKDNYRDRIAPADTGGNPVSRGLHRVADWVGLVPEGTDYIKRVIGLPGDQVRCCDSRQRVTVNGHPLTEPYVFQDNHQAFSTTVPAGHIFVMGDHRGYSYDSRAQDVGAIPENDVIGRAFVIIWPPSRWRLLSTPKTFQDWPNNAAAAAPLLGSATLVFGATAVRRRRRRARR